MLESLCLHLQTIGRSLAIPVTVCSSEVLHVQTWDLVKTTMKTNLVDHYGQAERVAFAYALEPSSYRFLPGYSFNELLPTGDRDDGTFEIVATALWNLAMPIVRYRTGDLVRLDPSADVDRVRFGLDLFDEIVGRESDYLLSPEGAPLIAVNHIPRGVEHVVRTQFVQQGSDVCIYVIAAEGFDASDRDLLLSNAARKLPPSMNVRVEVISELFRHTSGKVPFIVRR
jgi:phenylacetate-CoA ligase